MAKQEQTRPKRRGSRSTINLTDLKRPGRDRDKIFEVACLGAKRLGEFVEPS
jgi:hypothetical protein